MTACLWALNDVFRLAYVECVAHVHRITMTRFTEAHLKAYNKFDQIDLTIEQLSETAIEVVGPFLE